MNEHCKLKILRDLRSRDAVATLADCAGAVPAPVNHVGSIVEELVKDGLLAIRFRTENDWSTASIFITSDGLKFIDQFGNLTVKNEAPKMA
jgi:hypothetical protein